MFKSWHIARSNIRKGVTYFNCILIQLHMQSNKHNAMKIFKIYKINRYLSYYIISCRQQGKIYVPRLTVNLIHFKSFYSAGGIVSIVRTWKMKLGYLGIEQFTLKIHRLFREFQRSQSSQGVTKLSFWSFNERAVDNKPYKQPLLPYMIANMKFIVRYKT